MSLRVLTLSTLFPDTSRPNFGIFVERQTRALAARADVEVTVVAPIGLPPWPLRRLGRYAALAALPEVETRNELHIYRPRFPIWPGVGAAGHPDRLFHAIAPLVEQLHGERPFDVIDASFFFPDGPAARRLATLLGIPYSVKARGADIHYWGRQPDSMAQVQVAGRDAAGLLAVSAAMRDDMVALGMAAEKITVHYTGVDLSRFTLQDRAAAKAAKGLAGPVIATVGALIPRKGQAFVIGALEHLPDATLLLIGAGGDERLLRSHAARLGVAGRVRFLGSVPNADLPGWLAAADVMCLPSASEGLANAWVEALACGTPVVITDVGGARELVDRPEAGRLVERTTGTLAEGIAALLAAPPDPAAVRAAALRFTWEANGAALEAHLRKCAGR